MAGLLSFPVEILHSISQYLTLKDVLNCSETCHYLRMAFNDNKVWRKFVPEKVLQLEAQEQILEPAFQWEDTLTPLCDYKIHYMRLNHLLNNWKSARFSKYTTSTLHSYASGVFNVPKGRGQVVYKDRYLFLGRYTNDIESDGIEVWDVSKEPVVHSLLGIRNVNYDSFFIVGSYLVLVECKKVCVFQINLPEKHFPLLYSFIITETEASQNENDMHSERCDIRCVGWSNYNIGQYLVSNKCGDGGEGSVIHVWDIFNASKLGAFALPADGFSISVESHEEDEWLLRETIQSSSHSFYFLFNFKEKTFSETSLRLARHPNQLILYKSHILVFTVANSTSSDGLYDTTCIVYDLKTSAVVKERCFNSSQKNSLFSPNTIVNGSFILICIDCLQKIDALTLEVIDHFQFEFDIGFITLKFNVFGSTFVVAERESKRFYVWNVAKKEQLSRLVEVYYRSHLYLNDNMTKLVVVDHHEMDVLHFW